ncbi:GNAT family N-acetyltransferase [Pseudahrensia aquimaris]|uniref:GNAT family N-acetyltransferase n=1 Tax=Pseudahrensia aquimaris TaxID=744461 RepID=A0ABW3FC37_9HYPH
MVEDDVTIERNPDGDSVDWTELHTLLKDAFAFMEGRIDPPSSLDAMSADDLRRKARVETLFVARHNGHIIGCLFARDEGGSLYIGKLAVAQAMRGQGLARRLVNAAIRLAKEQGAFGVELQTRVELTENHAAFAKLGFEKVGESAHAGYAKPTSITMRLDLD